MKWIRRGSALAVLLIGWAFILVANNFHLTPPVLFLSLGFLAAVAAVYTLFRTGATAVAGDTDVAVAWDRPAGAATELAREKRALLKAIKEAEFDHQMGKLSKADADAMIADYRARAIEVIKELDVLESAGEAGSVRDRILREARARIEVDTKASDAAKKRADDKGSKKQKKRADALGDAIDAVHAGKRKPGAEAAKPEAAKPEAANPDAAKPDGATVAAADAPPATAATLDAKTDATPDADGATSAGGAATPDAKTDATPDADGAAATVDTEAAADDVKPGSKEAVS